MTSDANRAELADVSDAEVFGLIQQGKSLSDLLKELIWLRKWKEEQLRLQAQDSQRMKRLLARMCVSTIGPPRCTACVAL